MKLGENIFKLRKQKGLSQEQLGEQVYVTRQTISNWELGETSPNPEQLKLLSKALNISVDKLIGNDECVNKDFNRSYGYEYISKTKIKGVPLIHINLGLGLRKARGIIAIGNIAKGIISLGGIATGIITLGGLSLGLISLGGLALGILLSIGGLSIGGIALGGIAVGLFSIGGISIGLYSVGGLSIAKYVASGGYAYGYIAIGEYVNGTIELVQNEVTSYQIRKTILEQFPKTWDIIVTIISNISFR